MQSSRSSFVRRAAAVVGIALCVVAAIAVWILITGHLDATAGRVLLATFAAAACAVAGLVGAGALDREDARRLVGGVTILLAAIVLVLALLVVWATSGDSETLNRALGVGSALLAALVHAGLMLGRLRADDGRPVRRLTAAAVSFSACAWLLVAGAFVAYHGSGAAGFWRLLGVLAVLATLTTVLTPIARRLGRGRSPEPGNDAEESPDAPSPNRPPNTRSRMLGLGELG